MARSLSSRISLHLCRTGNAGSIWHRFPWVLGIRNSGFTANTSTSQLSPQALQTVCLCLCLCSFLSETGFHHVALTFTMYTRLGFEVTGILLPLFLQWSLTARTTSGPEITSTLKKFFHTFTHTPHKLIF